MEEQQNNIELDVSRTNDLNNSQVDIENSTENQEKTEEIIKIKENVSSERKRHVRLPMNRIKHIMKMDLECTVIKQDAVFLVTKATEMFLAYLGAESAKCALSSKRKTVLRRDVDAVIDSVPNLCFLEGALE